MRLSRHDHVYRHHVTISIQSYTNHTRKCVRSRSRTHGKISQHNSRHKLKIIQALYYKSGPRGLEYISSKTQESTKATISEYRHKLDKFALRRLSQKQHRSKRQGLLPGSLLTTPSRQRPSRSSRHPRGSSSHQWCHMAPGLRHLVASSKKNGKGEKEGAKQL